MGNLKGEALNSGPKTVADLDVLDLSMEVQDAEGVDSNGKAYSFKFIELNGVDYRVPPSVLTQIKEILEEKPDCQKVQVTKKGEGLKTKYTVKAL